MTGFGDTKSHLTQLRRQFDGLPKRQNGLPRSDLVENADFGPNPGNLSMLSHVPASLEPGAALVVAMHGCTQTAAAYDFGSGWSTLADRDGFALLCPEQRHANNVNGCFNWFKTDDTTRGHGEVQSIRAMIEHAVLEHGIDRKRIFVVGLSAGGAMANALLATYPEIFAAGAIIAGIPYGAANSVQAAFEAMSKGSAATALSLASAVRGASRHNGPWPKVSIWHGAADRIVNPLNADQLLQQWLGAHALAATPHATSTERGHTRRVWRDTASCDVIESYTLQAMGHGVPIASGSGIGQVSAYHFDVGVSSSEAILRFWQITGEHQHQETRAEPDDLAIADEIAAADARIFPAANRNGASMRAERDLSAEPFRQPASGTVGDAHHAARDIISATLKKAGLVVPEGSDMPAGDVRAIISKTLRSVGLLKD